MKKLILIISCITIVISLVLGYIIMNMQTRINNTENALTEIGKILGESQIVQKNPDGSILINQVITVADVQKAQSW